MAQISSISKASLIFAIVTIFSVVAVSAQDGAVTPALAPDAGSAFSVTIPTAVICSSIVLSLFSLFKH
ncbi:hypothetical protein AQUCO_03400390v1 [Aquilegia coerulea]|uniref:Uncharacterized protein n=1 Tax=Aquilegia coerulea TaxID=218851 RepID=A0A2G5CYX9_AQUCA|nr:hypothetical protein AQUCO_03400390v1 [Aquilegia coerulea]